MKEFTPGKQTYIRGHLLELTYYWFGIILLLGAALFMFLAVMDYFVTRDNFRYFLGLRISIFTVLILFFLLNRILKKRKASQIYLSGVIILGVFLSALTIELMIIRLGSDTSSYYAGLNLLVMCVLGFVPLSFSISLGCVSAIYVVYLAPILLSDKITDMSRFTGNIFFMVSTLIIALVWRSLSQKNLVNSLSLQYDLDMERKQLELYSTQLQQLVEERTKELNKSELMFRSLFEHANDGIMLLDGNGSILNVNNKTCEIHGFERSSLVGANVSTLETEENGHLFRERMERILAGESLLFETQHYRKDGSKVTLEVSSRAIEVDGKMLIQSFLREITEKQKLQSQLLQSQKMDSIGQLAGGIAHDFNNILAAILGFTELILIAEDVDGSISDKVKKIEGAARRGNQMISKLLSFARKASFEALPFNVNLVITDTLDMVSRLVPQGIEVVRRLTEPLPPVKGDPSQMEQVIMNLVLNARDAMAGGGKIAITTDLMDLEPGSPPIAPEMKPGKYIKISVQDTGAGIEPANLPHIFEPFFTTKPKAKGTGLGLALVYGIVKGHRGFITVESEPGRGTLFEIYLPAAIFPEPLKIASGQEFTEARRILAIDDEPSVLEFIKEFLEGKGFEVLTAGDPLDGIALYSKEYNKSNEGDKGIDLVITDIMMPSMDGVELGERIRAINPRVKIISISGFNQYKSPVNSDALLRKPFSGASLLTAISEVLSKKDRPAAG
jgi:PAS domain S-box-containing protein